MGSNFTVLYDACVLYPAPLRDLLMQLACTGLFRARWTDQIHDEWIQNLLRKRPDLTEKQLSHTKDLMNRAVPDCLVTGYEWMIDSLQLPDPDDRHVLAAAIQGRVDAIVTINLKDFPQSILDTHRIEALHPDQFITDLIDLRQYAVAEAAQTCHQRLKNPPKSVEEYLQTLEAQGLKSVVSKLQKLFLA